MVRTNKKDTLRMLKAKKMLEQGASIVHSPIGDYYHVESESKPGTFHVVMHGKKKWYCDCNDFENNNGKCKHILAVILLTANPQRIKQEKSRVTQQLQKNFSQFIREERGKVIANHGDQIIKVSEDRYKVKSQSSNQYYDVISTDKGVTCTCPDFVSRGKMCKHIMATVYHHESRATKINYPSSEKLRVTYSQDWSAYNAAENDELVLFNYMLKGLLESIPEPEQVMGRPHLPLSESLFCAIQKVHSQLSSRRAQGLFKNAVTNGQLDHAPHFNVPSKLFNDPDITPILDRLITLSARPVSGLETNFAIDSTGFRTTTFGAYYEDKYGKKRKHRWTKAHMAFGVKTNIVIGIIITDEDSADSPQFKPLLEKITEYFHIHEISADMAYSSRDNIDAVGDIGATSYIPFKKNATGRSNGSPLWKKRFNDFQLNRDEFMDHYHKRSNAESTNAAIKRKFSETLKSKNPTAQENELLAKIVAYNLTVIIHAMYENGITPDFLHTYPNNYAKRFDNEINELQSIV